MQRSIVYCETEAGILEALKNNPAECVGRFLGTPSASRLEAIPRPLVEASLNAKAEIIESSVITPSPPPKTTNMEAVVGVMTRAYRTKGYDIAGIAKVAIVQSLPLAEGCEVGYRFVSAISLDEKQSALVFKGRRGKINQSAVLFLRLLHQITGLAMVQRILGSQADVFAVLARRCEKLWVIAVLPGPTAESITGGRLG
jgi:hypothetical protein